MSDSTKWMWPGIWGLAASLTLAGALPASAIMSHDGHVAQDSTQDLAKSVSAQAGPVLMDKMSKAVEQIERQVQTKGPFQGAGSHAMQQGVLLVADDMD